MIHHPLTCPENIGSRKVVLTKWMLIIFSVGTIGYLGLLGVNGAVPPESFYTWFVFGLGGIGGAFTFGNAIEHFAKAKGSEK